MTISVELNSEIEARLTSEAVQRGMTTEALASRLLTEALAPFTPGTGRLTAQSLKELTELLTEGSDKLPILPLEVNNRESYYEDRW
jgi:hypothetical protein